MANKTNSLSGASEEEALYRAMLTLATVAECAAFFRDLCTPGEISAMKERWHVARLLEQGDRSYRQIHDATGVSIATISRVARFLKTESYRGYQLILERTRNTA